MYICLFPVDVSFWFWGFYVIVIRAGYNLWQPNIEIDQYFANQKVSVATCWLTEKAAPHDGRRFKQCLTEPLSPKFDDLKQSHSQLINYIYIYTYTYMYALDKYRID